MKTRTMKRGNSQCHYRYFPGSVYLHNGLYARVDEWEGESVPDINRRAVFNEILGRSTAFRDSDPLPGGVEDLELQRLRNIRSSVFPRTFYCAYCYRVVTADRPEDLAAKLKEAKDACSNASPAHRFIPKQFRFVSVHSCGFLGEGFDQNTIRCDKHPNSPIKLRTNNSERISNFRWKCSAPGCSTELRVEGLGHYCTYSPSIREIQDSGDGLGTTQVQLVTKNIVGMPEIFTRVNLQDSRRLDIQSSLNWKKKVFNAVTGGMELITPDLVSDLLKVQTGADDLMAAIESYKKLYPKAAEVALEEFKKAMPTAVAQGEEDVRDDIAEDMLDFVLAINQPPAGIARSLRKEIPEKIGAMEELGLRDIVLLEELNLTTVLFGYSRGEYNKLDRKLRFFPQSRRGRARGGNPIKVFCSPVNTEGIMLVLDPLKIYKFVMANSGGQIAPCPNESDANECSKMLANMYDREHKDQNIGFTGKNTPSAWMYRAIHSLSHLFLRTMGRYGGVEETSIAEMLFPSCCSVLLYVNQSGEFNLGTFATCFENYMGMILESVKSRAEDCLFDPICIQDSDGSCPACLQLGEICCEDHNKDLSRKYLVGGEGVKGLWES